MRNKNATKPQIEITTILPLLAPSDRLAILRIILLKRLARLPYRLALLQLGVTLFLLGTLAPTHHLPPIIIIPIVWSASLGFILIAWLIAQLIHKFQYNT